MHLFCDGFFRRIAKALRRFRHAVQIAGLRQRRDLAAEAANFAQLARQQDMAGQQHAVQGTDQDEDGPPRRVAPLAFRQCLKKPQLRTGNSPAITLGIVRIRIVLLHIQNYRLY